MNNNIDYKRFKQLNLKAMTTENLKNTEAVEKL